MYFPLLVAFVVIVLVSGLIETIVDKNGYSKKLRPTFYINWTRGYIGAWFSYFGKTLAKYTDVFWILKEVLAEYCINTIRVAAGLASIVYGPIWEFFASYWNYYAVSYPFSTNAAICCSALALPSICWILMAPQGFELGPVFTWLKTKSLMILVK